MTAPSLDELLSSLLGHLQTWIGQSGSFEALLREVFGTSGAGGEVLITDLVSSLETGQLTIRMLAGTEMAGLRGAYAVEPQSAQELIFLNEDWLASATVPEIEAVLLEELGHAIDRRLNGDRDTVGDEGERFSALVRGEQPAESAAMEKDLVTVRLEGLELTAEASTQPTLVSSTPSDGNGAVSVAADITLVFSEAVQAGSGNITIKDGSGNVVRTIAVTDATQVRFDGSKVILNPAGDLAALSNYSVQIAAGAITNLTGAAYAGISDTTSLNFTTGRILYATTERGNNSSAGAGTSSNPYKSLGYASEVVQAGDTIYLTVTNSSGAPLSGSEAIGNSYTIRSNGTVASPVVIKPNPASSDRYVFTSANGMIVTGSHTVIEGFEFYGKTDAVDYWSLVAKSWRFGGAIEDSIYPVGDIAINVTTGSNILIKDNYFHDLVQKAVNIEGGRYVEVRNNIIENIATTSLSGGHGIMRQQGSYSNFGTPDQAGVYRWDITGNLIFNVEQRIYSWVPSKGYLNMTLDEGKPINIDETTDTQMQARISDNIIGYANIDSIRLKPTANLEVLFNSIYSDGVHADGITDINTLGISTPFPGITVTGNLVQTAAGTFGFELNDAFNSSGINFISSNNIMFGGIASSPTYFTGVSTANSALFSNPEQGDFTPTTAAGNAGASSATRASLAAMVASQGVTVAVDNWSVDERKLVQALLDNIPGLRDGVTDNETIFEEAGMLYADSLKEAGRKAFYFAIDPTWKKANDVTDSSLDRPGTTYDGLYEIIVPIEYSDWLDTTLATYKQWDGSAFNGTSYSSARYGDSYIEQSKYFDQTGLSVFQINSASDFSKTTTSAGKTIGLDGDILVDLTNYTETGSQSFDIVTAGVVIAVDGPGNFFDHVRLKLASGTSYSHQLALIDSDSNGFTDTLRLTLSSTSSPPSQPVLNLGAGVSNGATAAESTQVGGVVTVTAEAGASVAVSFSRIGGGTVIKTVTGADATPLSVVLEPSDLTTLGNGTIDVSAIATNAAGSSTPGTISFTLDTLAPAAPTFALASDTGSSSTDGITNNGIVTVSCIETGAIWEYSTDSGTNWNPGAGTSFLLGAGSYASGSIQARQTDLAGNTSTTPSQNAAAITVDLTAPTAAVTVTSVNEGTTGPVINNGGTSNGSAALLVSGTLSAPLAIDETMLVFDGITFLGPASVTADSTSWSYTDRRVLAAGQIVNYTVGIVDTAGNQSAFSPSYVLTQTSSLPEISVNNASVVEGAAGTTTQAAFTVRLSRASTQPITVAYQVIAGTATSGSDYTATTDFQTLTFNPGFIALQVPFTVIGDSADEADEALSLQLSSPTNATFAGGSTTAIAATGTIMNDDTNPNQGLVITSAGNFKGSDFNDTLTGNVGANQINGLLGDDTISGLGGDDVLTGGGGAETFIYTTLSDSTMARLDSITDFNVEQGDKIDLNFTVTTVWNRGVISAPSLQGALQLAFADKDTAASGNQALALNELVVFQWGTSSLRRNTYIASPDGDGANFIGDLLIKLPNNTFGAINSSTLL